MNIHFGSLFVNNENGNIMQQLNGAEIKEVIQSGTIADIKNLLPGQLFEGDIAEINGLQVKIILDNHSILNASMNEDMHLSVGQHVIFQVKENTNSQIVIRPFQSEEGSELITRALNGSGIAVSQKNTAIVKELMSQGQPLDKQTIVDTIRLVNKFPEADMSAIVELKKHDIPVTADNLHMYEIYSKGNGDMTAEIKNLAADIPTVLEHAFAEMGSEEKIPLAVLSDILDIVIPEESTEETIQESIAVMDSKGAETQSEVFIHENKENVETELWTSEQKQPETVGVDKNTPYLESLNTDERGKIGENIYAEKRQEMPDNTVSDNKPVSLFSKSDNGLMPQKVEVEVSESPVLTVTKQLEQVLKLNNMQLQDVQVRDREPDMAGLKQDVIKLFAQAEPEERIELIRSETFKKLIHKAVEKNLFLNPDEIRKADVPKQEIEKLYERVKEQLTRLSEVVHDAIAKGSVNEKSSAPLLNDIKNMAQNMNFMNELNHMASYIQIPVKFTNQENGAELYVYNKNSRKTVEEGIQAFLHFDLESLGATDIRINLKKRGLRIGFELCDRVSAKLVEEHIEELTARLEEKGYLVNCNVEEKMEEEYHPLEEIFRQDEKTVSIRRYSLDIRT